VVKRRFAAPTHRTARGSRSGGSARRSAAWPTLL